MHALFILAFLANVALTLLSLAVLPSRVAIHFGADGVANGWAPNYVNALLMGGTHIFLFCALYFSPHFIFVFPCRWINLPNKDYWLQPAMRPQAKAKISLLIWQFGVALFAFLFVVGVLSLQANLAKPVRLNEAVFIPAFVTFLIYTVWWTIVFFRAFRLPREKDGGQMHGTACRRP